MESLSRLLRIGFELVGKWEISGDKISFILTRHGDRSNALYAFVADGEVRYVGKTSRALRKRLDGYVRPGGDQTTNIKANGKIIELLKSGNNVDIFAFVDSGLQKHGEFTVNLAAGLEDDIIARLAPAWNQAGNANRPISTSLVTKKSVIKKPPLKSSEYGSHADNVRKFAFDTYVNPARVSGKKTVIIRAGDIHNALGLRSRHPLVCSALLSRKFSDKYNIQLIDRRGPPQGANVYLTYKI